MWPSKSYIKAEKKYTKYIISKHKQLYPKIEKYIITDCPCKMKIFSKNINDKNVMFVKHHIQIGDNIKKSMERGIIYFQDKLASSYMLKEATKKNCDICSFLSLARYFEKQESQVWCGIGTIVLILNGLGMGNNFLLSDPKYIPYGCVTQTSLWYHPNVRRITGYIAGTKYGLTLEDTQLILNAVGCKTTIYYADEYADNKFKTNVLIHNKETKNLIKNKKTPMDFLNIIEKKLKKKNTFIILNYKRTVENHIGMMQEAVTIVRDKNLKDTHFEITTGGGHWCPIGAIIHIGTEKNIYNTWFLIMEVSSYKYNWFWARGDRLFNSCLLEPDTSSKRSRGIICVSKK